MTLLAPLAVHASPALALLIEHLGYEDIVALLVYALETDARPLARLLCFHGRRFALDRDTLVRVTVAQGCGHAARALLACRDGPSRGRQSNSADPDLHWLKRHRPQLYDAAVMDTAARRGDMPLVQWLHTTCVYATWVAMESAAAAHHLEIVHWLAQHQSTALRPIGTGNPYIRVLASLASPDDPFAVLHWNTWMPKQTRHGTYNQVYRRAFVTRRHFVVEDDRDNMEDDELLDAMEFAVVKQDKQLLEIIDEDMTHHAWPCTQEAMHTAARAGDLDLVQWLHGRGKWSLDATTIEQALRSGSLALLQWLESQGLFWGTSESLFHICLGGSIESVQWICERWPDIRYNGRVPTALQSNLDVLHFLCCQGRIRPYTWMLSKAAMERRLDILQWCINALGDDVTGALAVNAFNQAVMNGHLPIVRFLYEDVRVRTAINLNAAVTSGQLRIVEYLLAVNPEVRHKVPFRHLNHNALYGRFDMVRFLLQTDLVEFDPANDPTFGDWFAFAPLSPRHRVEVRGLVERELGRAFDEQTHKREVLFEAFVWSVIPFQLWRVCEFSLVPIWAAVRGHLDILCALMDGGYDGVCTTLVVKLLLRHTNASSVVLAILEHHPEVWDIRDNFVRWAARTHDLRLIAFLVEQATTAARRLARLHIVALTAARVGHVEVLRWVRLLLSSHTLVQKEIYPWRSVLWTALRCGQVDASEWLLAHGFNDNLSTAQRLERVVVAAARSDDVVGVLQWLMDRHEDAVASISASLWTHALGIALGRGNDAAAELLRSQVDQ